MSKFKIIFLTVLFFGIFGLAKSSLAATINATDCGYNGTTNNVAGNGVGYAISQANSGDTITVQAGNCIWTKPITITKNISLIGAWSGGDSNGTTINASSSICTGYQGFCAFITYSPANLSDENLFRVSGFLFNQTNGAGGIVLGKYLLTAVTPKVNIRIDHNQFIGTNVAVYNYSTGYGVVDNNIFNIPSLPVRNNYAFSMANSSAWDNLPFNLGQNDYLYFEDNVFSGITGSVTDCDYGGRYVFRNNTIFISYSQVFDLHGNIPYSSCNLNHSQKCWADKLCSNSTTNNPIVCNSDSDCSTGNTCVAQCANGIGDYCRAQGMCSNRIGHPCWADTDCSSYGGMCLNGSDVNHPYAGSNMWSCFGAEIYGNKIISTSSATSLYQDRGGKSMIFYNSIDTGSTLTPSHYGIYPWNFWCSAGNPGTPNNSNYLEQAIHDTYYWRNVQNENLFDSKSVSTLASTKITPNFRAFCFADGNNPTTGITSQNSIYGPKINTNVFSDSNIQYNDVTYTTSIVPAGVDCGNTLPQTCTVGYGYWLTNQSCSDLTGMVGVNPATPILGTLYKCMAPNTWTAFYTPYTYPHPLTLSSVLADTTPPSAPSGLSVQ